MVYVIAQRACTPTFRPMTDAISGSLKRDAENALCMGAASPIINTTTPANLMLFWKWNLLELDSFSVKFASNSAGHCTDSILY